MLRISKLKFKINEKNDDTRAQEINNMLKPLHKALFIESNPSPVKYAASLLNLAPDDVRLPLVKVTEETKLAIKQALKVAKLL